LKVILNLNLIKLIDIKHLFSIMLLEGYDYMDQNITYDRKSFFINGERVFINSASIHYFRMPKEEWRETLIKAKLSGINCIDTYLAWNIHEPEEGKWDFSGDKDYDAFLKLCKELGLWTIVRPGPFICAEWDFGGFPYWLINKVGIKFRDYNEVYLKYVDLYFDKVVPIIAQNQITSGGSVIMVQVENEYDNLVPKSTPEKEMYLNHLRDGLISRGIDVQLICCNGFIDGTVSCINFWSGADKYSKMLKEKQPDAPLFNTEFWTGWFENWGANKATQKTPELLEKRTMEMVRAGYKGINQYMFFGGTNFGSFGGRTVNNSDIYMVTSYDYDAPLNEYCCITPKYYVTKRVNYFINTVARFLIEAKEVEGNIRASSNCIVRERIYKDEKMYFIESKSDERETNTFTIEDGRSFEATVKPNQIVPVVVDYRLNPDIVMTYNSFFSFYEGIDGADTLVVYSDNGQRSKLNLVFNEPVIYNDELSIAYKIGEDHKTIEFDLCHFNELQEVNLKYAHKLLRIIILNTEGMDKTWFINSNDDKYLVIGCDELVLDSQSKIKLKVTKEDTLVRIYGTRGKDINTIIDTSSNEVKVSGGQVPLKMLVDGEYNAPKLPSLKDWYLCPESESLDASNTKCEAHPKGFAEFGKDYGYLLYTTEINSNEERETTVVIPNIQDTARVYLNGEEVELLRDVVTASLKIKLNLGINKVQFLVQNMGRYNYSHFLGEEKGIFDTIYLDGKSQDMRQGWMLPNGKIVNLDEVLDVKDNTIMVKKFYNDGFDRAMLTGAISENIWINGKKVDMGDYQEGWHFISIDISPYLHKGLNRIEMKYYRSEMCRLELSLYNSNKNVDNWSIGEFVDYDSEKHWKLVQKENMSKYRKHPTWYKCAFKRPEVPENMNLKLKLRMTGMGKGFIFLNGINVGRMWQIGPQEDYKLPMPWLKDENELVIFDEEGRNPDKVRLLWEDSSRGIWI